MPDTVKIFIGSGEESFLERRVLIYSIRKHTKRDLDIQVFNGTHNTVERDGEKATSAPLSATLRKRNLTEFSLYRYLIPECCGFEGKAIYLDSDMLCLTDIGDLFDLPLDGNDFLCTRAYRDDEARSMWATSALLIDCERCRFDLPQIFDEIDRGSYIYTEFSQMRKRFLNLHPYQIGELDQSWNVFDRHDPQTRIIHYTNLPTQPWKDRSHPYGNIWYEYLSEARDAGFVTDEQIEASQKRYARLRNANGRRSSFAASFIRGMFSNSR